MPDKRCSHAFSAALGASTSRSSRSDVVNVRARTLSATLAIVVGLVLAALLAGGAPALRAATAVGALRAATAVGDPPALSVSGNQLEAGGQPVQLRGVDYTYLLGDCEYGDPDPEDPDNGPETVNGTSYSGTTDGLAGTVANMASWDVNTVRLVVNVHCWLGDSDPAGYGSQTQPVNADGTAYTASTGADEGTYEKTVLADIAAFNAAGMYVIVDPFGLDNMPDPDYVEFWQEAAKALAGNGDVLFDPYNEIALSSGDDSQTFTNAAGTTEEDPWSCWEHGCYVTTQAGTSTGVAAGKLYEAPGMQDLLDAIRGSGDSLQPTNGVWPDDPGYNATTAKWSERPDPSTGATQPITLGGLDYDSDFSEWMADRPADPDHAIVLDTHRYDFVEPGLGAPSQSDPGAGDSGENAPDNDAGGPGDGAGDATLDSFLSNTLVPLARQVPVIFGEVGELYCDSAQELDSGNAQPDYTENLLTQVDAVNQADGLDIGALGYEWRMANPPYFGCPTADPPGANNGSGYGGPLLLENASGTPTGSEGAALQAWLRAEAGAAPGGTGGESTSTPGTPGSPGTLTSTTSSPGTTTSTSGTSGTGMTTTRGKPAAASLRVPKGTIRPGARVALSGSVGKLCRAGATVTVTSAAFGRGRHDRVSGRSTKAGRFTLTARVAKHTRPGAYLVVASCGTHRFGRSRLHVS